MTVVAAAAAVAATGAAAAAVPTAVAVRSAGKQCWGKMCEGSGEGEDFKR